jgi:hypothetical protein
MSREKPSTSRRLRAIPKETDVYIGLGTLLVILILVLVLS